MNWGHSITIAFVLFAATIITMVTISMKQDVSLVAPNYYEEELAYQDQIDRINAFEALDAKPTVEVVNSQIVVSFPDQLITEVEAGGIHLFRPSQANQDQKHKLSFDSSGKQYFNLNNMAKGLWRSKLLWKSKDGAEYYFEKTIVI